MMRDELRAWKPRVLCVILAALLVGCRTGQNYPSPEGPRYAGTSDVAREAAADDLHVVTFNIAFSFAIDSAIALLTTHPDLRGVDVLLLQEMDATGTQRIASALGMSWVYYPAIRSVRTKRDFGNAVLSRWPIVADAKLILPHRSRSTRTQRIATAASLAIGTDTIRVYSFHFGTAVEVSDEQRRDQLALILDDADRYSRVVMGGDTNDEDVGRLALERGYAWPTREGPRTTAVARWDHLFTRGVSPVDSAATGTIPDARAASDHRPVWLRLRPVARAPTRE